MSTKTQPAAATICTWLRANLGPQSLGCLTGGSSRALLASVQIIACCANCDEEAEPHILSAFRSVVMTMPSDQRELAYHAIAHVLDWSDRHRLWVRAQLPQLEQNPRRCKFEGP